MSVNILDQNGNLKKIAHGFPESKFNVLRADIIENIELTDTASKNYAVGDYLIMANGQLVKVINAIPEDSVITSNDVQAITVEEMIAAKVDSADIVDAVTDGDMRAVTSNAVHDALESKISTSETTGLVKNDGSIDTKSYAEKVANGTENNLAGLDENGNLKDSGWSSDKTTTSATGNPISISGLKSNQLAINPVITFEPIQAGSGTPSPSNIRAISGYDKVEVLSCGVNIWDEQVKKGYYNVSSAGEYVANNGELCSFDYIRVNPNTSYYFKKGSGTKGYVAFYDINKTYLNSYATPNVTFTTPIDCFYITITLGNDYGTTYNNNIGINYPATDTSYHAPNKATSISESLGQTVYGGTLDVRTGKLTVDRKAVDLGTLTWQYNSSFFYAAPPSDSIPNKSGGHDVVCAAYACYKGSVNIMPNLTVTFNNTSWGGSKTIAIKDTTAGSDPAAFKTAMSGVLLVYPLETPFTIQLTPHEISLLKDYAYVSTNGTNIAFDYHNGELASLADVSQLGETVNELGEYFAYVENVSSKITMSSSALQNQLKAYKIGRFVHICLYTGAVASANTTITLGRVGASLLNTNANVCGSIGAQSGNDVGAGSIVIDNSSGDIKLIYSKTTTYSLLATFTYILP